ncbi:MAG TPA: hydroxymethylbilane synthase [Bryobacteraceae bacterium]|nr:hydroxymethylbilane synthase [Bryobacteraceae bacterium]
MIVVGSRGSKLALWQAHHIAGQLNALGHESRIEIIKTSGDRIQDVPLAEVGGKGLFTKEIEEALLADAIDLAVHSMKDVPTELPAGLTIAAIPEREDPHDALIGCTVAQLLDGMRIGTSSLRRSSQLLTLNPRLSVEMLRGNVDTRLRKLDESQYDAIVLAAAGLRRLGWQDRIRELIPVEIMCPAVGQGALAIETRDDGGAAQQVARQLDHPATNIAVTAERAMLSVLGGGCQVPIGGYAYVEAGVIHMRAIVASPDGRRIVRAELSGVDPARTGASIGRNLLEQGADAILRAIA